MPPTASGMRACAGAGGTEHNQALAAILAQHTEETDYFEVGVLPLVGLDVPGVPGSAPEELPEVSLEDEPEGMPDELLLGLLLGLLVEELPEPDVP